MLEQISYRRRHKGLVHGYLKEDMLLQSPFSPMARNAENKQFNKRIQESWISALGGQRSDR